MVFPVVMHGCESWTIKKAEHWWIDAFELWCWRRQDLESPLDYRKNKLVHSKGNQSWISVGRTDAEAETPILWSPDAKNWLIWKDPDAGKEGGEGDKRGWDSWMASPTLWTWVAVSSWSCWCTGKPGVLQSMGSQRIGHDWLNWTEYSETTERWTKSEVSQFLILKFELQNYSNQNSVYRHKDR